MFWYIVLALALVWQVGVGYWAVSYMKNQLNSRLKFLFQEREMEERFKAFRRTDFKNWNHQQILRNIFLFVPTKLFLMLHCVIIAVLIIYPVVLCEQLAGRRLNGLRKVYTVYVNYYVANVLQAICRVKEIETNPKPRIPEPITISNHVCWFEIYYMVTAHFPISFLAKSDVERMTFIGTIAKFGGGLFVDRGDEDKKDETLNKIKQRCEAVEKGESSPLLIFPEGTISNNQQVITFKRGAFEPLSRIKIVGLKYKAKYNVGMDNMGQLCHTLLFLSTYPTLQLHIIHDVKPRSQDPKDYADQCRQILAKEIGVPLSECRFRDYLDLTKILKDGYEQESKKITSQ